MQFLFFFLDSHALLIIRSRSSAYEQSVSLSYSAWQVTSLLHEGSDSDPISLVSFLWEYLVWQATTINKELSTKCGKPISQSSIDRKLFHWVEVRWCWSTKRLVLYSWKGMLRREKANLPPLHVVITHYTRWFRSKLAVCSIHSNLDFGKDALSPLGWVLSLPPLEKIVLSKSSCQAGPPFPWNPPNWSSLNSSYREFACLHRIVWEILL